MILTAITLLLSQEDPDPEVDRVWAKVSLAVNKAIELDQGNTDWSQVTSGLRRRVRIDERTNNTVLSFGTQLFAIFDNRTGRPLHLSLRTNREDIGRRLAGRRHSCTREVAEAVARVYIETLLPALEQEIFAAEYNGTEWEIQGNPIVAGRPLAHHSSWLLRLDGDRLQLNAFYSGPIPNLSLADSSVCSMATGQEAALDAYSRHRPFQQGEVRRTWLAVGTVGFQGANEMTEEHRELARQGVAIPLYLCHIDDLQSRDSSGHFQRYQTVYVDARNGRPLGVVENSLLGSSKSRVPVLAPQLDEVEVIGVRGRIGLEQVRCVPLSAEAKRILLKQGRKLLAAYLAKDGHLRLPGSGATFRVTSGRLPAILRVAGKQLPFGASRSSLR